MSRNEPVWPGRRRTPRSADAIRRACGGAFLRCHRNLARWLGILVLVPATIVFLPDAVAEPAGAKALKEYQKRNLLYADERWQKYLRDIGARILEHTPEWDEEYHFYVLDDAAVNAVAMPGRYIFFSRGLLAYMRSEDELAAVVGHEIAHITAGHFRRRNTSQWLGRSLGWLAQIGTARSELRELANMTTAAVGSSYGREYELEADRLGGEYMARAGYDPMAVLDMLQVLKDQDLFYKDVVRRPMGYHGLFASHPKRDKRLHDAVAQSQGLLPDEIREPVGDFWELIDGLVYGDEAARGLVRDSTYFHGALRVAIEFPKGWLVTRVSSQVRGVAPGGAADGFVTVARHAPVKRKSPEKYVEDVLQRDDVTSGEELDINNQPAFIGEIDTSGSNVQLQLIGVLYSRDDVFLFKGECGAKGDPEKFREQFRATMAGLRPMTTEDANLANSQRIAVIVANPGQTYAELARGSPLRDYAEETLRLLNGGHPNGEPRAGDYIKIVR